MTYLGTQHDGSNPTQDPLKNDPQPSVSAYIINVRGSDTLNRLKVERPIAKELQQMRLRLDSAGGGVGEATFKLFRKNKELFTETFNTDTRIKNTKFSKRVSPRFSEVRYPVFASKQTIFEFNLFHRNMSHRHLTCLLKIFQKPSRTLSE